MQPVNKDETIAGLLKANNEHLINLCNLKQDQQKHDNLWREKWQEAKRSSSKLTLLQLGIGVLAFAIGIIEVDQTNGVVIAVKQLAASVAGVLL